MVQSTYAYVRFLFFLYAYVTSLLKITILNSLCVRTNRINCELMRIFSCIILSQHEIETLNTEEFKRTCNWLQMLTQLIEEQHDSDLPNAAVHLAQWSKECEELRYLYLR